MEKKKNNRNILIVVLIIVILLVGLLIFNLKKKDSTVANNLIVANIIMKMEEYPIEIMLPKINIDKTGAVNLNEKIMTNGINDSYEHYSAFKDLINEGQWIDYDGTSTTYDYEVKNNIIAIYITTTDKDGSSDWPAAGNGEINVNYFYDVKNDKELSMIDALPLMGYTSKDLKKFNITKFSELFENDSYAYYEIKNGKGQIVFYDCREGCAF